jgi:cytochrome c oxidase assembly protein subunit 15
LAKPYASLNAPSRLANWLVGATFVLLVFGASVRVNGAGLACPDWPLCFGKVIPEIDYGVAFEFGHRVYAGLIALGFLALGAMFFRARADVGRALLWGWGVAGVILLTQIVLGGLTVLELLAEWTVASHLVTGNLFCVALLLIAFGLRERMNPVERAPVSTALRVWTTLMALAIPTQLALGGYVSGSHAGLACGTWPTCDGVNWFPTFGGLVGLQLMHRVVAYGLLAGAVYGAGVTRMRGPAGRIAGLLLALVLIQAGLGVANVLLQLKWEITLAHTAGAASLMLCTAWLNWEAWRAPVMASLPRAAALTPTEAR